jgi:hypothetical protein
MAAAAVVALGGGDCAPAGQSPIKILETGEMLKSSLLNIPASAPLLFFLLYGPRLIPFFLSLRWPSTQVSAMPYF